jgi:hypothetical protein
VVAGSFAKNRFPLFRSAPLATRFRIESHPAVFVIPAKVGIHSLIKALLDARVRGHDKKSGS